MATVVAGVLSFWIIVDFPDDAMLLAEVERIIQRLQRDDQLVPLASVSSGRTFPRV